MIKINQNYQKLKDAYLFAEIANRTKSFKETHPNEKILLLGVGDVTQPLNSPVINALHKAVDDQAKKKTFHGYVPECGRNDFKKAVAMYYRNFGVILSEDEIFASSGAGDELGDILDLFSTDNTALIPEPTYPAYVDTNVMARHKIIHLPTSSENGFVPMPNNEIKADIIYLCSPNNPTGAAYSREVLSKWVQYALNKKAVIIFDAAYEAFITDDNVPHSIYEIEGSSRCAIEICSLSKTAGFTGMRCGYTVVPNELVFDGISLNKMWVRNRTTKTNGVSYVLQKAAIAALSVEGRRCCQGTLDIYRKNAETIMSALDRCNIPYFGGNNAPYIWLECPNGMDSWTFFDYLLQNAKIVGTPGEGFGECGKYYFRLSAFGNPEDTALAAERLKSLFAEDKNNARDL